MADKYEKFRKLCYSVKGIKQSTPDTCWCAALAWWVKALKGSRPQLDKDQIYWKYSDYAVKNGWNGSNLIAPDQYEKLLNESKWRANVEFKNAGFGPGFIKKKLEKGPIILGYWGPNGGHAVVAVAPSLSHPNKFMVMDPAYGAVRLYGYGKFSSYRKTLFASPK